MRENCVRVKGARVNEYAFDIRENDTLASTAAADDRTAHAKAFNERWEWVVGYEELYQVSSLGRVRSVDHWTVFKNGARRFFYGRALVCAPEKHGYHTVTLHKNGRQKVRMVHHLVLLSFVGQRPAGAVGRHLDGNRANNISSNLAWGTALENAHDCKRHGNDPAGERNPRAKLSASSVESIKFLHSLGGYSKALLGRMFGVQRSSIRRVVSGEGWRCEQ